MNIVALVRRFTVEQWVAIDAEYRDPSTKTDAKGIGVLVLAGVLLTIKRYYGRTRGFRILFGGMANDWPIPGIWPYLYGTFASLILHFLIPSLFIYFIFREGIQDHGFRIKGIGRYKWLYLAMFLVVLPTVIFASRWPSFIRKYPLYSNAGNSWTEFLIWETAYGLYFVALEFFFRGFMLFTLARYMGAYAIFVMVIPYAMIHFGKPFAETLGSVIAGAALGTLALRTRSIFGGVLIHVTIAWAMDISAIVARL
ncbi:type II CAAX prenyl endopeptidase Rce1 family protein [Candidatus Poribacteria bacterium]